MYESSIKEIERAIATRGRGNEEFWSDCGRVYELLVMGVEIYRREIHEGRLRESEVQDRVARVRNGVLKIAREYLRGIKREADKIGREIGVGIEIEEIKSERDIGAIEREVERVRDREKMLRYIEVVGWHIKYVALVDKAEALVAYRDLMEFACYMEKDLPKERRIITMAKENGLIQPIMYTSQKMVLGNEVKKLFKNTPTGYFKSYSDIIIISWINGVDESADCLKVVGNPKMVTKTINGVSAMMLQKRYANVFPEYRKYECDANKMFKILAPRVGEMLVAHARGVDFSVLCISKETPIDGGRYKYRFYDDITNSKYKTNVTMHDSDNDAYNDQWKKRRYTEFSDCEWFTGTVYYYLDFLSRRRNENGFESAEPMKQFKYTKYNKDKKAVFVVIPKLDYETDESTFPQLYSTEQARIDRANDFDTFQAMEQGIPNIPEGMPFDYSNMKTWETLPLKNSEGGERSDFTWGALDLPRTGNNNLSLMVFSPCGELHYLVDAIYEKKPIDYKFASGKTMLDLVCEKIVERQMKRLVVETNVCSNIKTQIEDKLSKLHYSCKIEEIYSTMKKEDKIFNCQSDIQQHIVIPKQGVFGLASDVGKAVYEIVTWSVKAKSDDSIDTVAMYVRAFVNESYIPIRQITTFRR